MYSSIEEIQDVFLKGDPLINLVLYKLGVSSRMIFWIMISTSVLIFFGYANFNGTLKTIYNPVTNEVIATGTLDQPGQLIISFFVQPVLVSYYFAFNKIMWDGLEGLYKSGIFGDKYLEQYQIHLLSISQSINSKLVTLVGLTITSIITIIIIGLILNFADGPYWLHQVRWLFFFTELPKTILTAYAIALTVIRISIFQMCIGKIYETVPTKLDPFHEDNAGGYASIGKVVSTYFFWLIPAFGFYSAAGITQVFNSPSQEIPGYLMIQFAILPILSIFFFFFPLLSTHTEMKKAVARNLSKFTNRYKYLERIISSQKSTASQEQIQELSDLIDVINKIRSISPDWPFDTQIFNKFLAGFGTSLVPIIIALIDSYT
ncbi:hypothetical protein PN441_17945 [Spirulina major CS-329]|uniref:hypothetical protein n=1 Tax=Spirulina TaxID=1154 RepID=UPI00232F9B2D|nr:MULTISPECIES: hypothetical protein [Spirulina]MDB9494557.1 hypothetical protein [Spirulina subsalsa CS-330]MDB9504963.1 hypothetical protein [Spirulina major CS-329]